MIPARAALPRGAVARRHCLVPDTAVLDLLLPRQRPESCGRCLDGKGFGQVLLQLEEPRQHALSHLAWQVPETARTVVDSDQAVGVELRPQREVRYETDDAAEDVARERGRVLTSAYFDGAGQQVERRLHVEQRAGG
jgi:hypothetical protein